MTDQAEKKHSAFWGVMVIAGTVIGGGMFALPVDLAGAWFFWGAFILIIAWFSMLHSGLLLLEANLNYPVGSSFNTITKDLIGNTWNIISGITVAFVLYILTYAYISANGAIISETISMNLGYHANPRIVGICTAIFVASVLWISSLAASRITSLFLGLKIISFVIVFGSFFFQFRDSTVGAASDVFATFGSAAGEGKLTHTFTLGMYSNYYIMIMPRNNAGEVVIDNIKITREDSKPIASGLSLTGDMAVGGTLTASYTYTDYENDPEGASVFEWFAALSPTGMNKVILENTGKTLQVTEDMLGKYIGFQVTPVASQGDNAVGAPVLYMATETVGGTRPDYGETFSLGYGESFTEDFEADVGEDKNLVFVPHGNTDDYIYYDEDRASNVLRIKSDGSYLGTDFSGISFAADSKYTVSFDYTFITVPNTFYVQLRGSTMSDSFYQLPTESVTPGEWLHASGELTVGNATDAYLMLFPDASAVEILIDNLKIEREQEPEDTPPGASGLSLTGDLTVGSTLTAQYTYTDAEQNKIVYVYVTDDEGTSIYLLDRSGGETRLIKVYNVYSEEKDGATAFTSESGKTIWLESAE